MKHSSKRIPFLRPIEKVLDHLPGVVPATDGWMSQCPAHFDGTPSLSINLTHHGRILLYCHAGCDLDDVLVASCLSYSDLRPTESNFTADPPTDYFRHHASTPAADLSAYWTACEHVFQMHFSDARRNELAQRLQLPTEAIDQISVGFDPGTQGFTFLERDANGETIGIVRRFHDGTKHAVCGSKRGLIIPAHWMDIAGPVYLPEGPSDVVALLSQGLSAIGRPSATGGGTYLTTLIAQYPDREFVVLGENDQKADGSWPGRSGAYGVARKLEANLCRTIEVTFPPAGFKDIRDFVTRRTAT